MKRIWGIVLMFITVLAVLGCGTDSITGGSGKSIFTEPGLAAKAISELKETPALKGKDIQVFQNVLVSDLKGVGSRIDINILVPDTNDKVDNYVYQNGKWASPQPVQISGDGDMKDNVMPIDSIDYSKIPDMYKIAQDKAKEIEGGKVDEQLIYIFNINERKYDAHLKIEGAREKFDAIFDSKGNLIEMKKE